MTTMPTTGGGRGLARATAEKDSKLADLWLAHELPTSVDAAADALAFMSVDPSIEAAAGQILGEGQPIDSSPESHGASKARRCSERAAGLTGFDPLPHPGARA